MAFIYIYATVHWYLCRVQCVCFMKTKAVDPHSNREGGLAEYSLFIKYQLKEKKQRSCSLDMTAPLLQQHLNILQWH